MKPAFVGIGAQKCASTWLYRILAEHPSVCVAEEKEVDFFSYHFDHGYQWYEAQFAADDARKIRGEISPSYFCESSVPQRIHSYTPDAKILLCLRDPLARALSNHRHEVRVGHISGPDIRFETGLANNPMYVEQGLYATHLKRWLRHFPAEQIHVVLMEEIRSAPQEVAASVYRFLSVAEDFVPEGLNTSFNRSYANKSQSLAQGKDLLYMTMQKAGLGWAWNAATRLGLRKLYRNVNTVESREAIPDPEPETLDNLRNTFRPEVRELESLLGKSLDSWLR